MQISSAHHFVYTSGFLSDWEYGVVLSAVLFKLCTDSSCENLWLGVEVAPILNMSTVWSEGV